MAAFYLCLSDVVNKCPRPHGGPYIDVDYRADLGSYFEIYSFVRGHVYAGQAANHPQTREPGILFTNHAGQDHFISANLLRERFEGVEP